GLAMPGRLARARVRLRDVERRAAADDGQPQAVRRERGIRLEPGGVAPYRGLAGQLVHGCAHIERLYARNAQNSTANGRRPRVGWAPMRQSDRFNHIITQLSTQGSVGVGDLVDAMGVSAATIRRDLA